MLQYIKNIFAEKSQPSLNIENKNTKQPISQSVSQSISIMGTQAIFYGHAGDKYYDNLSAHAAQNSSYIAELLKLKSDSTVIDVGANIGVTTVAAARCVPHGRVLSLEPSPKAFAYLEKCISENALTNVTILNVGAGETEGNLTFVESEFLAGSYVALNAREESTSSVQILTLDQIVKDQNLQNVGLIKIDVEGF